MPARRKLFESFGSTRSRAERSSRSLGPKGAAFREERSSAPSLIPRVGKPSGWLRYRSPWFSSMLAWAESGQADKPFEIMVPVALDVLDTQGSHHGQILKQGDGTDVGQILSGKMNGAFSFLPLAGKTRGVGNPLDDSLAIFVTHPVITQGKGLGKGIDGAVSFIDNEGRTIGPIRELVGYVRRQRSRPGGRVARSAKGRNQGGREFFRSPAKFPNAS